MDKESRRITEYLLGHRTAKLEELASHFGKSQRTIYNYIGNANAVLSRYGASIVSRGKDGYSLMILDEELFAPLRESLGQSADYNDQETRLSQILYTLLFAPDYIKMEDLAEQLYVSRSLLKQDMQKVREILGDYGLSLTVRPHYGMRVEGDELSRRACLGRSQAAARTKEAAAEKKKMKQMIRNILTSCLINADYRMSEDSLDNLVMHIYIAVRRMQEGTYIHMDSVVLEEQKNTREYGIAVSIVTLLSELFGIEVDENEYSYITLHLRSKRITEGTDAGSCSSEQASRLSSRIIQEISQAGHYDFAKDLDFVIALNQHMAILLLRGKLKSWLKNPLLPEIKEKMAQAYELAIHAGMVIDRETAIKLDADEIGFLALHIETALERRQTGRKKILLVCSSGKGTANLMKVKFKRTFQEAQPEITVCAAYELDRVLDESFDCIFTTIDLKTRTDIPIIKINSMIDDMEIEKGKNQLAAAGVRNFLAGHLRPELLITGKEFCSREEAISVLCEECRRFYTLPDRFEEAVYAREAISPTEFDCLFAVPHPIYPMTEESFIAIAVPRKPFMWEKQQVSLVILFSCSKTADEQMDRLFEMIGGFVENQSAVRAFAESASYESLLKLIEGGDS